MYEKKIADGFEALEIPKGTWVEAIFAKEKPEQEKPRLKYEQDDMSRERDDEDLNDDEDLPEVEDHYNDPDEDEDDYDEDKLTEESYRTTFETEEDLSLDAVDAADDDDY